LKKSACTNWQRTDLFSWYKIKSIRVHVTATSYCLEVLWTRFGIPLEFLKNPLAPIGNELICLAGTLEFLKNPLAPIGNELICLAGTAAKNR